MSTSNEPRILVLGGRQRKQALDLDEWQAYERAIVLELNPDSGQAEVVVDYLSPDDVCPSEKPSIVFKAGDVDAVQNRLLVCTQTEIIEYCTKTWRQTFYFSHPSFNDLHHVCYRKAGEKVENRLLAANTGLDQVIELKCDRDANHNSVIVDEWSVCSEATWVRFDATVDYRRVSTTKPHQSHPNYTFEYNRQVFATRFHQQDAVNVSNHEDAFIIPCGNPHDGRVNEGTITFTTTNGHVVVYDLETRRLIRDIDLNSVSPGDELLGWCRAVDWEGEDFAWVGFSRIRPTWLRKNLSWIKQGFRSRGLYGTLPTRISKYDLTNGRLVQEFDLEPYGVNAVFGIYLIP